VGDERKHESNHAMTEPSRHEDEHMGNRSTRQGIMHWVAQSVLMFEQQQEQTVAA
jgi:hypothetical protein